MVTEAFLPLGTYLLFAGFYISAKNLSRDAELRKKVYKKAESQLDLLRTIGISEMEKEIEKQVKSLESISKRASQLEQRKLWFRTNHLVGCHDLVICGIAIFTGLSNEISKINSGFTIIP